MVKISQLTLQDFRSHEKLHWKFSAEKIIFLGRNGIGKTNILEALNILSIGRSWRTKNNENLINNSLKKISQENNSALISVLTDDEIKYETIITARSKKLTRNDKNKTFKSHLGSLPTLLFTPELLHIFRENKANKQAFFDRFLLQIDPEYLNALQKLNLLSKEKNTLFRTARQQDLRLEDIADQLEVFNEMLCEVAPVIWEKRHKLCKSINQYLPTLWQEISAEKSDPNIILKNKYEFSWEKNECKQKLQEMMKLEWQAGRNLFNPQRDDFVFTLRGQDLLDTASRGETRSALLCILIAQKKILQEQKEQSPILLLDDCFSELDSFHQQQLSSLTDGIQTFFTTTHREHFANFKNMEIFTL
jgi:DNA replication and repair protein RecF